MVVEEKMVANVYVAVSKVSDDVHQNASFSLHPTLRPNSRKTIQQRG